MVCVDIVAMNGAVRVGKGKDGNSVLEKREVGRWWKEEENHAGTAMQLQEWRNVVLKDEI